MPSTVRIELNKLGFDWKNGTIVAEDGVGRQSSTGRNTRFIDVKDVMLDYRFSQGNSVIDIPRVFAKDAKAVYFPMHSSFAGARMVRVATHPDAYVKLAERIPYPGDE